VADACSGINSLIALVTLATVYAYVTHPQTWRRLTLIAAAVPLAMFGNLVRVTSSAIVGNLYGQEAIGSFDNWSTFVVFIPAIAVLLLVDHLLDLDWHRLRDQWFSPDSARG
jgi:exosortase/archaeosortase family protein